MSRIARILGARLVTVTLVANLVSQPSQAAPPPPGYPSATIISVTMNPRLGIGIPLRRGFYDADQDAGFGWDKLWSKHNIWDSNAVKVLAASPNATPNGSRYNLATWAGKLSCTPQCRVTAQVQLTLGVAPYYQKSYTYTSRLTGKAVVVPIATNNTLYGVVTGYCVGTVRCPKWVTYSLTNPGKVNPYRVPVGSVAGGSTAPASTTASSAEETTMAEVSLGNEAYVYSYEPFPTTVSPEAVARSLTTGDALSEVLGDE